MTWLTEDPTPVLVVGGLTLLVLVVMVWKTGRGAYLVAMAVVALSMGGAVLVDFLVVTEREQVEQVLYGGAAAAEANDIERLKSFLAPEATALRGLADHYLRGVVFEKVRIGSRPQVEINPLTSPPSATADCLVVVRGKYRIGETVRDQALLRLRVELRYEDDRWRVTAAEPQEALGGAP